jgi:hypothetical protein
MERQAEMQTVPQSQSLATSPPANDSRESRQTADRVYQGVTIVAMLLLLVTLWVF